FEHYGVARPADLARKLYTGDLKPAAVATLASMLQDAADEGDRPALEIIEEGGRELGIAAASVGDRLQLDECTVVLAGGAFRAVPRMRGALSTHLAERLPHAHVEMLETEPAMGAVRLARRVAAGESVVPRYVEDP